MWPLRIPENVSPASWLRQQPAAARARWLRSLSQRDAEYLADAWGFWARPDQISPWSELRGAATRERALREYDGALALAGRGWGKTRYGSEATSEEARILGPQFRGALVARTAADIRDVMLAGPSGLLSVGPPDFRPRWEPSNRRVVWPNGAMATTYTAEEPDQLRGPQHNWAWGDEIAAWRFADAYDQLSFGLRLPPYPRAVYTTTPRPTRLVRDLLADPRVWRVRGRTADNADNLAASFLATMRRKYEGTTLGRQELDAEVMDEAPGALWRREMFRRMDVVPDLDRVVVAIDPSATANDDSDEAGIVAGGSFMRAGVRHAVILGDYSARLLPSAWAARGVALYDALRADRLVAEVNHGGEMVRELTGMVAADMRRSGLRASGEVSFRAVTASRGKATRAEPVVALYEQGRVWHAAQPVSVTAGGSVLSGRLADMEDQMCTWVPGEGDSPDRLDALVWLVTDLVLDAEAGAGDLSFDLSSLTRPSAVRER